MLEIKDKLKDKISITQQQQEERKLLRIGTLNPYENHICFELDLDTNIITRAEYITTEKQNIHWFACLRKDYSSLNTKLLYKENCIYCTALNEVNARKRFNQMLSEGLTFKSRSQELQPILSL